MELLNKAFIFTDIDITTKTKEEALQTMGDLIATEKKDINAAELIQGFSAREKLSTTGFGNGIAMPHAKLDDIEPCLAVFKFSHPIEWAALDGEPVKIAFAILAPNETDDNIHLKIISGLARKMMNKGFVEGLHAAKNVEELFHYLKEQL